MTISQIQTYMATMNTVNTNSTNQKASLASKPNFLAISTGTALDGTNVGQLGKKKKAPNLMPTIRFELNLEPPTSDKCSEFNYNKLVVKTLKLVKKKSKQSKLRNVETRDAAGKLVQKIFKEDLSILASNFLLEKKRISDLLSHYRKKVILSKEGETNENDLLNTDLAGETNDGFNASMNGDNEDNSVDSEGFATSDRPVKSKKSKKKSSKYEADNNQYKIKDFNYLGQGYDEEDSFIDNSEAIDDRAPVDMVPKKGGFYINKGNLKMKNIEEQKQERKAKKQEEREASRNLQRRKSKLIKNDSNGVSGDEASSTDEDFNPGEGDVDIELLSSQESSREEEGDAEDSDDEESSDSDSDSDSDDETESDEDESEISEVSAGEEQLVKSATQLRRGKKLKSAMAPVTGAGAGAGAAGDSDCEIIEIESGSNSGMNAKRNKKKRPLVEDDEEDDSEGGDDDAATAGKENIEARQAMELPKAAGNHDQNAVKRKRPKENSNGSSSEPGEVTQNGAGQPSSKQARPGSAEPGQMNTSVSSNSAVIRKNVSAAADMNLATTSDGTNLSTGVPANIKGLVTGFIGMFFASNSQNGQCIWTEDMKTSLYKIYTESNRVLSPSDKSNVFAYISNKIGKKKETLLRHIRTKTQQQQAASQQSSSPKTTSAPNSSNPANKATAANDVKQAYYQRLQNSLAAGAAASPPLSSSSKPAETRLKLAEYGVSEPLRNKLTLIENHFQQFKGPTDNFFASPKIISLIYSVDSLTKTNNTENKMMRETRNFAFEFLCSLFGITRDIFLKKLHLIKLQHNSALLTNKVGLLKRAVEEEMPKQQIKYKQTCDDYLRQRAAASTDPSTDKKLSAPRKKFEWTVKARDLFAQVVNSKLNMWRLTSRPPSQSPSKKPAQPDMSEEEEQAKRTEFLRSYLAASVLPLWPEGWMQMSVLMSMSQGKLSGTASQPKSQQQQRAQMNASLNVAPSSAAASSPLARNNMSLNEGSLPNKLTGGLNLVSKSGKQVKLLHQPLNSPQMPPGMNQSSTPVLARSVQQKSSTPNIDTASKPGSKFSPPIINLTNTRTQNLSTQQANGQPNKKLGNQSLNLEKSLNNAQNISNTAALQQQAANLARNFQHQIDMLSHTNTGGGMPLDLINFASSLAQANANFSPKQSGGNSNKSSNSHQHN